MPRIKQLRDKNDVGEDQWGEIDRITEVLGNVGALFTILLHSPGLAQKVMEMGAQVRLHSELTGVEHELAVLATCREKDATNEWNGHVKTARRDGVREEAIDAIRSRADVSQLEPDERDIITYVRQLLQTNRVEQSLFDELVKRHSDRWMVELAATVGQYQYVAAITGTFDIVAGPGADPLPV